MLPVSIQDAQGETISGNFGAIYFHFDPMMPGNPGTSFTVCLSSAVKLIYERTFSDDCIFSYSFIGPRTKAFRQVFGIPGLSRYP